MECPALESFNDYKEYALELIPVPNACCPKVKRTGCRHIDKIFLANDEWYTTEDYCTKEQCIENVETGLEKRKTTTVCNEDCDPGFKYVPATRESQKCCGSCKQVACVIDGIVRNVGDKWTSDDYCTKYECVNANDSVSIYFHANENKLIVLTGFSWRYNRQLKIALSYLMSLKKIMFMKQYLFLANVVNNKKWLRVKLQINITRFARVLSPL